MKLYFALCFFCLSIMLPFSSAVRAESLQTYRDALSSDMFIPAKRSKAKVMRNDSSSAPKTHYSEKSSTDKKTISTSNSDSSSKSGRSSAKRSSAKKSSASATHSSSSSSSETYTSSEPSQKTYSNDYSSYDFGKKYASSLFRQYDGHITIEEENIPRRISVTKGSTLQLNLFESAGTFWNLDYNPDALKIVFDEKNKENRTVVFETLKDGSSKISFDYISTLNNDYKVLKHKTLIVKAD